MDTNNNKKESDAISRRKKNAKREPIWEIADMTCASRSLFANENPFWPIHFRLNFCNKRVAQTTYINGWSLVSFLLLLLLCICRWLHLNWIKSTIWKSLEPCTSSEMPFLILYGLCTLFFCWFRVDFSMHIRLCYFTLFFSTFGAFFFSTLLLLLLPLLAIFHSPLYFAFSLYSVPASDCSHHSCAFFSFPFFTLSFISLFKSAYFQQFFAISPLFAYRSSYIVCCLIFSWWYIGGCKLDCCFCKHTVCSCS